MPTSNNNKGRGVMGNLGFPQGFPQKEMAEVFENGHFTPFLIQNAHVIIKN